MTAVAAGQHVRAASGDIADASTRRHRYALWALLAVTAGAYLFGLSRNGWANDFYAAAVQAGTKSWKAFFFGSFDASNFITVDKTPASLWVMELSARLFGLNYWSLLVPQALEGVASVAVLYAAVRRWHGPWAGLLAGAALAVTPVAALMFRYNNPDALLVLLMTVAAYAMVRAIESGRTRWLVLAGALLGLGFLTKMLQAFLLLPPFGLAFLVAGPRRWVTRIVQLLAGLAAVLVAAGWWVAAVLLTPAADRPYIGGSTDNNILQLAFGYNGFGRLDGDETGSVGFTHGTGPSFSGQAGLGRLFADAMGGQISWLLPAALLAIGALLWLAWRARPSRLSNQNGLGEQNGLPDRRGLVNGRDLAAVLLWGGWLLITAVVFSYMQGIIHPYYTVALAPAIAALTGIGAVRLWQVAGHGVLAARCWLAVGIATTAIWSYVLLDRSPEWLPVLRFGVLVAGLAAAVAVLVAPRLGALAGSAAGRRAVAASVASVAVVAGLAGPVAYSLDTIRSGHTGALPSAGPATTTGFGGPGGAGPAAFGRPGGGLGGTPPGSSGGASQRGASHGGANPGGGFRPGSGFGPGSGSGPGSGFGRGGSGTGRGAAAGFGGGLDGGTSVSAALTRLLEQDASSYTWVAATVGSESAAPLQLATGDPVMSIGGFNGTDQAPTLAEFERYVAEHKIHYFVGTNAHSFGGGSGDAQAITNWVTSHFRAQTVGGETVYNLTEPVSG
jgi:4-amino-4-deoxy-L-arabinose transferase-like glycosyltransferase